MYKKHRYLDTDVHVYTQEEDEFVRLLQADKKYPLSEFYSNEGTVKAIINCSYFTNDYVLGRNQGDLRNNTHDQEGFYDFVFLKDGSYRFDKCKSWDYKDNTVAGFSLATILVEFGNDVEKYSSAIETRNKITSRNPQTALCVLKNGKVVFIVADGRTTLNRGLTGLELRAFIREQFPDIEFLAQLDGGGSVIGSMYTWKPTLKHRRTVNQLKADMDTLSEFQRTNTLTPEENSAIDEVIRLSEKAIKDFNAKSVIGDAIKMEKDQVTPKNAREIQNNLYKFLQPEIDHENQNRINAQNTISNIQKNAQEILSLKGIKMDALQYSMLEDGVRKQVDKVQNYANELGVNLVFDTNAGSDGMYDPNTGTVIIDPNSDLGALTVFTHELTHGTESSRFYEPLKNMILNENAPESVAQGIQRIKEVYSNDGVNLDDDGALKEYVAIQTQELLGNDKFVKRLVKYNNSLAYRIYDGIKNLVSKTDTLKDIEYNFLKAFRDSGMNPEVNTELQLDPQYLLRRLNKDAIDEDGKVKSITSQLKDFFSGKFGTRDKLIAKTDSKGLEPYGIDPNLPMTMDQSVIKKIFRDPVKGGHNDSIDESVIEYVVNHPEDIAFAVKNNWGNYAFIYDFNGKNGSPILMSVQPSEDSGQGLVINNITSMYGKDDLQNYIDDVASRGFEIMLNEKSGTFAGVRGVQFPNAFQQVTTSNDNISNSNEDVKKYSKGLREKDLLAIHNLDENKLKKSLELGGLAMPSIAVTKDSINHEGFGDMSLVFDKDTIDPKKDWDNYVYSRDAWTPSFPNVEYRINENEVSRVNKELYESSESISKEFRQDIKRALNEYMYEDSTSDSLDGMLYKLAKNDGLKALYLEENGTHVEPIYKEVTYGYISESRKRMYQKIKENYGEDVLNELDHMNLGDFIEKHGYEKAEKAIVSYVEEVRKLSPEKAKNYVDKMMAFKKNIYVSNAYDYFKNPPKPETKNEYDSYGTREYMNSLIDENDYRKWLENKFKSILGEGGIYNGKEHLTPRGRRRTFEELHDPYTLESVVDSMRSQDQTGTIGFGSGFNTVLASRSKSFSNLQDIIDNEGQLSLNDEVYQEQLNSLKERYSSFEDKTIRTWKYNAYGNAFTVLEELARAGVEAAKMENLTTTSVKKAFKKYDFNITDAMAYEFVKIMKDSDTLTTDYFEAKPRRAVSFNEAKQVYYPKGTSEDVLNQLRAYGVETIEYDPSIEGDRTNKIKENATNYKFSKGLSSKDIENIKKIAPNSIDENGNTKDISRQLSEMEQNPSSFGLAAIPTKKSLEFLGIGNDVYLTNKVFNKMKSKHGLNKAKISYLLENLDSNTVLGVDYTDSRNNTPMKNAIIEDGNNYYLLTLRGTEFQKYSIDTISSLYPKNDIFNYLDNAISKGNQLYINEKSDAFITSYTHARSTVGSTTSNDNISYHDKDVKYSKGLNPKDLTESSFKTLSKDYNIKDPKLRELYDEVIDDIKTSGIVFNDTYDNIVDYIVNNSKEKVENSLKEEAKKYFGGKTFYLPPNYSRDISGENMFETNRSLPNGIRLTKNFAKDHLDSALNEFIEMNGIGEQWGINTQDQFNSLLDLLRSDDDVLKKNIYGKELFEQEVKYDIDKIIDSITTQTEEQSNKGITPEDINKVADADLNDIDIQNIFSNRREKIEKKKIERIEKMKERMIGAAQDWIPNYDVLRNKYDEIDPVSFNKALFQTLVYGEVDEDIKADIKQQILEQSFADEKYNKTVESFLDDVLEHFSTDAIYQNDKRYMGSIAQKVNNILKGYDGFTEGTYEENYKYVESMKKAQETIGKNRKEIFDYNEDDYKNLVNVGKDYGSHWKTLSQNLDVIANKNANLRTKLSDMFELPFYNAQTSTVNALQKYNDVISSITRDLDIREGSKESKATQWILEKKKENGSVYDEDLLKKEFDYQMKNGKKAYENIMEASKKLRDAYDEIFNTINKQRSDIYGEIEIENMMDTEKLRAKVSEAKKMVNNIEEQLAYKPSPELQAGYDKAKKEYTKLVNQLNTKLSQDASDDSTRRQKLPYRENYAHHVIKRNGFFKGLVNAIRGGRKVPTKLSGISDYAKPKTGFANFFIQQKGGEYEADAIGGFADYIKSASRIIGYDPLVNYYRNVANDIRSVAKGNEMSSFVNWLSDYTNSLAGKTNETDRAFRKLGPRFINAVGQLNQRVIRNSLMFNLRTAITQIGNIPNGFGVLTKNGGVKSSLDIAKGATDFAKNIFDNKSAPHLQSPFLSSRYFDADTRKLGVKAKAEEVANFMLSKGDELSTKLIWYSAYDQAIRKGEQDPIMYADDITRRSVAGRNFGELPLAMQSKMINLAIPFQVEVNNAYQTLKGMISTKEGVGGLVTILLADWLLNNLFEELWGDRVLFDPIDVIAKSIEEENGLIDTTTRLGGELLSNMPGGNLLTSTLLGLDEKQRKKLFGESDPSRYGLGNIGLKGLGEIAYDALNGNLDDATSNLIASYLMPGGGKQAQRSIEALQTYGILPQINDGKLVKEPIYYTKSGKIGFVQDEPQENIFDFMKNVAFGKWAGEKGREYIDGGFKSLTDTQGELFKAFSDVIGARQNKEVIDEIKSVESLKDEDGKTVTNSKGLEIRNIMEREGLWEAYKDSFSEEETTRFDVGKKVYGMTSEEFFKEYERVFGGKKEEDKESVQEPKKEPTYTYYEEENIQDFANKNGLSKDKADEINDIIAYREALTDENGKTVRNSAALKVRKQFVKMGVYDDIVSYINENGLKAGDFGLNKTVIAYDENEFNQKYSEMYEGKTYNQTEYTPKKKTSKRTSSKSYKKEYEKIINAFTKSTQTPEQIYKQIDKILNDFVFNDDIKKTVEDVRKRYLKEGLYDLIKKYLKDNPYADASAFGL